MENISIVNQIASRPAKKTGNSAKPLSSLTSEDYEVAISHAQGILRGVDIANHYGLSKAGINVTMAYWLTQGVRKGFINVSLDTSENTE